MNYRENIMKYIGGWSKKGINMAVGICKYEGGQRQNNYSLLKVHYRLKKRSCFKR